MDAYALKAIFSSILSIRIWHILSYAKIYYYNTIFNFILNMKTENVNILHFLFYERLSLCNAL
jgi:hypothetical protein